MSPASSHPSQPSQNRRASRRHAVRKLIQLSLDSHAGTGVVHDISTSGARIEYATVRAPLDATVRLRWTLSPEDPGVVCRVARRTESGGFCVRFESDPGAVLPRADAAD